MHFYSMYHHACSTSPNRILFEIKMFFKEHAKVKIPETPFTSLKHRFHAKDMPDFILFKKRNIPKRLTKPRGIFNKLKLLRGGNSETYK